MAKKFIIAAIILLLIGAIGMGLTYKSANEIVTVNETQTIDYDDINSITINSSFSDIEIIGTDEQMDDNITLVGKSTKNNKPSLNIKVDKNKKHIKIDTEQGSFNNNWFNFNFNFSKKQVVLKVYVPEQLANTLKLDTVSGDMTIKNVEANLLNIDTVSGDVKGDLLQFKESEIDSVSGNVNFNQMSGAVRADTTSGDVILAMKELNHTLEIDTTSGNVNVMTEKEPQNTKFTIETISGVLNLFDKYSNQSSVGDGSVQVDIETISGDIILKQQ